MNILNFSEKNPHFWMLIIFIATLAFLLNSQVLLNFDGSALSYLSILIFVILIFT